MEQLHRSSSSSVAYSFPHTESSAVRISTFATEYAAPHLPPIRVPSNELTSTVLLPDSKGAGKQNCAAAEQNSSCNDDNVNMYIADGVPAFILTHGSCHAFEPCKSCRPSSSFLTSAVRIPRLPPMLRALITLPLLIAAVPFLFLPIIAILCLSVVAPVYSACLFPFAAVSDTMGSIYSIFGHPVSHQAPRSGTMNLPSPSFSNPKFIMVEDKPPLASVVVRLLWALATLYSSPQPYADSFVHGDLATKMDATWVDLERSDPVAVAAAHLQIY